MDAEMPTKPRAPRKRPARPETGAGSGPQTALERAPEAVRACDADRRPGLFRRHRPA